MRDRQVFAEEPATGFFKGTRDRKGFALLAVIWSLGLIALMATVFIVGARYRSRTASNDGSIAVAAAAAESAVNVALVSLTSDGSRNLSYFPLHCRMPGGERATISIEQETGKVDLNTASPAVLVALFTSLSGDQKLGTAISANILAWRKAGPAAQADDAKAQGKQKAVRRAFTTIMELDQVEGVSAEIFQNAIQFVTVHSGRAEPDHGKISAELRSLLRLNSEPSSQAKSNADTSITIRADVSTPYGIRFIREALVSLKAENGRPFVIREWRRGELRREAMTRVEPFFAGDCFRLSAVEADARS